MRRLTEHWVGVAAGLTLSLATACGTPTGDAPPDEPVVDPTRPAVRADSPERPEGHRKMIATLAAIAEESKIENPFLGLGLIPKAHEDLAALPEDDIPVRWFLNMFLGKQQLRLGDEETALEHYLEANRLIEDAIGVPEDKRARTLFETGVAFLRRGQIRNCVERPTGESCIFPIREEEAHTDQEDTSRAIDYLLRALDVTDPLDPTHLRAQWLITIAYMSLGAYPDDVPQRYLIPPERFESDEPFKRFTNIAPALQIDSFDLSGAAVAEDFNGDGLLDLMVSTSDTSGQMRFYVNVGDGFTEKTVEAGLHGLLGGLNMVSADYDNDGDVDVYVLRGGWFRRNGLHPNSMLRNNGDETFTDVTFEAGLGEHFYPTQTASWADYDNDGDLDLYVGNENGQSPRPDDQTEDWSVIPSQLFRNNGDGTFTDVAAEAGVENLYYAKGVIWGDYNHDRFPDLYVSNAGYLNRLFRNNRDGTFTDVARELGVTRPIASFPVWFWDVNGDGLLDLYVAAYGGAKLAPDVASVAGGCLGISTGNETAKLYIADGKGGFLEKSEEWGVTDPSLPMGANFGDLDNDGYPDFYLGTGYPYYEGQTPNVMYRNQAGKGFANVTTDGGFGHLQKGHAVVFADLDNDGDQDLFEQMGGAYTGDAFGNVLYENPGFGNHWLKVRLVGVRSNRFGVGARVRVDVVEHGVTRSIYTWINTGGSFGANPLRKEIGLGQAERIEMLEVYWPTSDQTQRFQDVALDRGVRITEGDPELEEFPVSPLTFARRQR